MSLLLSQFTVNQQHNLHNLTLKYIHNLPLFMIATTTPDALATILSGLVIVIIILCVSLLASSLALLLTAHSQCSTQDDYFTNNSNHFTPLFKSLQWYLTSESKPMSLHSPTRPQMVCLSFYPSTHLSTHLSSDSDWNSVHFSYSNISITLTLTILPGMTLPKYLEGLFL